MAGPFDRREYAGAAVPTTIISSINSTDLAAAITDVTGWLTGSGGRELVVLDEGKVGLEEKAWVTSRVGSTVNFLSGGRGAESTTAVGHAAGCTIRVVGGATDFDEANYWVAQLAKLTTKGDMFVASAANTLARLAAGADGNTLVASAAAAGGWVSRALAESDVANLVADLAARVLKSTWTTKGDILPASGASTPVRLGVGADGTRLVADSTATTGLAYSAVKGEILAYTHYFPVANSPAPNAGLAPSTDVDATNLAVTFIAPPSGTVLVELRSLVTLNFTGGGGGYYWWNLRSGGSDVAGTETAVAYGGNNSPNTYNYIAGQSLVALIRVSGLTPGTSYTYKWGQWSGSGISCQLVYGGFGSGANAYGPATMLVMSA